MKTLTTNTKRDGLTSSYGTARNSAQARRRPLPPPILLLEKNQIRELNLDGHPDRVRGQAQEHRCEPPNDNSLIPAEATSRRFIQSCVGLLLNVWKVEKSRVETSASVSKSGPRISEKPLRVPSNVSGLISKAWYWMRNQQMARSNSKRLRVTDTISLGEKRFAAVIQFDGQQYLVGGGGTNMSLLAQLNGVASFEDLLKGTLTAPNAKAFQKAVEITREQV